MAKAIHLELKTRLDGAEKNFLTHKAINQKQCIKSWKTQEYKDAQTELNNAYTALKKYEIEYEHANKSYFSKFCETFCDAGDGALEFFGDAVFGALGGAVKHVFIPGE